MNVWTVKFSGHILLKPSLKDFEHYLASTWNEWNCDIAWTFSGIALLWNWSENWPLPVLWSVLSFPNLLAYRVKHFNSIISWDQKYFSWNSITFTSFVVMLPKAHLTSHSRKSGSRWVNTSSWLSGSWRSFCKQNHVCLTTKPSKFA